MTDHAKIDQAIESLERKPIGGYKRTRARAEESKERRQERRIAHRIAKSLPEDVRRYWTRRLHPSIFDSFQRLVVGSDHYCSKCGCHRPDGRVVVAGMEMVGALPEKSQVQVNLFQKVGVRDESELGILVDSGRRMRALSADATASPDAFFEEALALVEDCIKLDPARRQAALARLGGMPTEAA